MVWELFMTKKVGGVSVRKGKMSLKITLNTMFLLPPPLSSVYGNTHVCVEP